MKNHVKNYGFTTADVQPYEQENRTLARRVAEESIVLLKNDQCLPLHKEMKIGLFGSGASKTVKGGTGSGNVNERYSVSIYDGLKNAGQLIVSEAWIDGYDTIYALARQDWKKKIAASESPKVPFLLAYFDTPFSLPAEPLILEEHVREADVNVYVISRDSGEGYDRKNEKGDFQLSDEEYRNLAILNQQKKPIVLILNVGGLMDLSFMKDFSYIKAMLNMSFAGEEGGAAVANLLTGKSNPSGRLTDTFAFSYEDWPSAYSVEKATNDRIEYNEDIFVGYKWFDSFNEQVAYPFGYGLSYTDFKTTIKSVELEDTTVSIVVETENIGDTYAGKDVKQLYCELPSGGVLEKEKKRLIAFSKTALLAPHESKQEVLSFDLSQLSSFDEAKGQEFIEQGVYTIVYGQNAQQVTAVAQIEFSDTFYSEKKMHQVNNPDSLVKKAPSGSYEPADISHTLTTLTCTKNPFSQSVGAEKQTDTAINDIIAQLSIEEKLSLVVGKLSKSNSQVGAAASKIYSASGETSSIQKNGETLVAGLTVCDGPAGLRLSNEYQVDQNNDPVLQDISVMIDEGEYGTTGLQAGKQTFYRYCTAFPVGSCLAQSWDSHLLEEVGLALAVEMDLFGIDIWLAPGMNIHRYPLCGRNFEYFSEDPLLSGHLAAAIVMGVQKDGTKGATIKHFACNNQETDRMSSNSIVSERALRELYLKNFENCLERVTPVSIMTSYNKVNEVHSPNNVYILTTILRDEFNYTGLVMTDWTTTTLGGASAYECLVAENNLIMPGARQDIDAIMQAINDQKLSVDQVDRNVYELIKIAKSIKG